LENKIRKLELEQSSSVEKDELNLELEEIKKLSEKKLLEKDYEIERFKRAAAAEVEKLKKVHLEELASQKQKHEKAVEQLNKERENTIALRI